jgi:non-specific serine/threonine protein kinase
MSERDDHQDATLRRMADDIADATPVDWEAARRRHPDMAGRIESLAQIERVAVGFRVAGPGNSTDGQPSAPRPHALFAWGPLLVLERLGAGSFGEVFRAFDTRLDREVALKLRRTDSDRSAPGARRFLDEARAQARVRHPNVLVIHGADVFDDRVGLWTDLVQGETLESRLQRSKRMDAASVVDIGVDLCRALSAVHLAGLVHGDVTTRNLMQDRDGRILLMDFGSFSDAEGPGVGVSGTPLFLAPEILAGGAASTASDLYALGVVLYRIATGRYPIDAHGLDELVRLHHERGPDIAALDILPARLASAIARALQADPQVRHASAAAMESALRGAVERARPGTTRTLGNLPVPTSSFIGRARQIEEIREHLQSSRIVTLTGSGGCGKSRLATHVLLEDRSAYPDGTWIVELAAVQKGSLVAQTVARELGLQDESGRTTMELLVGHLDGRRLALLLDNCEHLLDACAQVSAEIVRGCAEVRILATSREALGVAVETAYAVPPLDVPAPRDENAETAESVRLFVDRARAADPAFRLSEHTTGAVVEICRRLDGIPLAIELAGSRVRSLEPQDIAARLDDRFRLLTGGRGRRLPHHQTLETLIAWSHDLLTLAERSSLARLSVFAGGWSLPAAERVCGGGTIDPANVRDILSHLSDKSLIERQRQESEPRFRMLESVREYAARRLAEAGETAVIATRHLEHFLGMAERVRAGLQSAEQERWIEVCSSDHDNFRAALDFALSTDRIDEGVRIASALWRFWDMGGRWSEAAQYYEAFAAHPRAGETPSVRAEAQHGAAKIAYRRGDLPHARVVCEQAIRYCRDAGDAAGATGGQNTLGVIESTLGNIDLAIRLHEESLTAARTASDPRAIALALGNLAILLDLRGDFEGAHEHYAELLPVWRALGDRHEIARTLTNLGHVELMRARHDEALRYLGEAESMQRELADPGNLAETLLHRAFISMERGDAPEARTQIEEALAIARRMDHRLEVARAMEYLGTLATDSGDAPRAAAAIRESLLLRREAGEVANMAASIEAAALLELAHGDPARAATMLAATNALRDTLGWIRPRGVTARIDAAIAALETGSAADDVAHAMARGAAMNADEIADVALETLSRRVGDDPS